MFFGVIVLHDVWIAVYLIAIGLIGAADIFFFLELINIQKKTYETEKKVQDLRARIRALENQIKLLSESL